MLSPFETPILSNRKSSAGVVAGRIGSSDASSSLGDDSDDDHDHHRPLRTTTRPQRVVISAPTLQSSLRTRRRRVRSLSGPAHYHRHHNVTFFGVIHNNHDDDNHSLPDSLANSSLRSSDDDGDDDSSVDNKSLDSIVKRQVSLAIPKLNVSEITSSNRASDGKTYQHSDRRVSLTFDMETGKMAGSRAQHVTRRSGSMMEAQSPRLRRRRGLNYFVKKTLMNGDQKRVPDFDSGKNDDHDDDDGGASKGKRGRLWVQSTRVTVADDPIRNKSTGRLESRSHHEEVQYRLSALKTSSLNNGKFNLPNLRVYEETMTQEKGETSCCCGWQPNLIIVRYLVSYNIVHSFRISETLLTHVLLLSSHI